MDETLFLALFATQLDIDIFRGFL